jgi:PPOX class probable FMN-dependent enzyme
MAKIADLETLRGLYRKPSDVVIAKQIDRLDPHCRAFIALSPFVAVATQGPDGLGDVTPRGDPPGFVAVLDEQTLALPDRPGNKRLDTLSNVIANPGVGLLFLIPGFDDTLRVNGIAEIRDDDDLRARFEMNGKLPATVMIVHVKQAYLHCAKAFIRSRLWNPESRVDRKRMPSLGQIIKDQISGDFTVPTDEELAELYRKTLY